MHKSSAKELMPLTAKLISELNKKVSTNLINKAQEHIKILEKIKHNLINKDIKGTNTENKKKPDNSSIPVPNELTLALHLLHGT